MTCVVAKFVCNEGKLSELMDILSSSDGLEITHAYNGCKLIEASTSENGKTLYLYELWDTKEDHQAYLKYRGDTGLLEALGPILAEPLELTYSNFK
jgi:quinol monooxygenase YgiN